MDSTTEDVVWRGLHPQTTTESEPDCPEFPQNYPDYQYHIYYDQIAMMQADPSASTSILNADTPSWSEIDGILSDKYRSDTDPGEPRPVSAPPVQTQSTQDTVIQRQADSQESDFDADVGTHSSPIVAYYSQPQFRERSFIEEEAPGFRPLSSLPARLADSEMSTPPRSRKDKNSESSEDSFGSSQRERIARLRQELFEEEERVMARSDAMAQSLRNHAVSALIPPDEEKPTTSAGHGSLGLDSSQQLSHSILDSQSRTRLKIAKPPSLDSEPAEPVPLNSASVDITPLTEDLLMNSRTEHRNSDGGQTISDGQFPNDDDIIFTPLSDDDDYAKAFATPPRVMRKVEKRLHKPTPTRKSKVQLQSDGRVIGTTELGSFDETSSLSIIDRDILLARFKEPGVKPLRRHAWSDSETENSLSKTLPKQQFNEIKTRRDLPIYPENFSTNLIPPSEEDRPRSAFAVLSPHEGKYRPLTAPSSDKRDKFGGTSPKFLSEPERVEPKTSEISLDSNDYPNLKSSFMSLQNTIMSDIAALRREIVDKQEGTEKLRAEFSDFKHAYYQAIVERMGKDKEQQDAKIQTSQTVAGLVVEDKENMSPVPPLQPPPPPPPEKRVVEHKDTSYSECDSETDRQLATLRALQRSLREQSNENYLKDIEQRMDAQAARTASPRLVDRMQQSSPAHFSNRGIQTSQPAKRRVMADAQCNTSDVDPTRPKTSTAGRSSSLGKRTVSPKRVVSSNPPEESSLDSTEAATRDLFMDILRKKAEMDEEDGPGKQDPLKRHSTPAPRNLSSSTPKHGLVAGRSSFTPASVISGDSTLTDSTFVHGDDVTALNALWSQFMKFVVQSKAVKQRRSKPSSSKAPCIQLDVDKLEKLHESFCVEHKKRKSRRSPKKGETYRKESEAFEVSAGELRKNRSTRGATYRAHDRSTKSIDSREERINRLINEIEDERRRRQDKRSERRDLIPADLDNYPVKEHKQIQTPSKPPSPPPPPRREKLRSPVAFEISLDGDSIVSEDVERAPGYPNMVFKTGKLQDAFLHRKQRFIRKSRRRALQIQLCKEARQKYSSCSPPERPRPTIDAKYFDAFDVPPPRNKVISHREMVKHSKKIYNRLAEVTKKKYECKVARERETHRLKAQLFNKRVQDSVLGKRFVHPVY